MNNVEHFKYIATQLSNLYEAKNADYGDSFSDTYDKFGIISALTRISDKYNRVVNLVTGNGNMCVHDESIVDTLRDMASYCIMTVMKLEDESN